jgi:GNAT superfamily N-acetyltransferase
VTIVYPGEIPDGGFFSATVLQELANGYGEPVLYTGQ